MFRSLPVLFLLVAASSGSPNITPRILGGAEAEIGDFPYTASIEILGRHSCGATILSVDFALVDANCVASFDEVEFAVRVGSSIVRVDSDDFVDTGTVHNVTEKIFHPLADIINREFDFALVRVDPPFEFNANVAAAVLPALGQEVPEGVIGVVTGWGQAEEGGFFGPVSQLHYANVTLVSDANCTSSYNPTTLCATRVDGDEALCWHDEGGPLVVDGSLFGVVLWTQFCTNPREMMIFSKVSVVRDWLDTTISG